MMRATMPAAIDKPQKPKAAKKPRPEDRGQLKREQLLTAAADCFRSNGFHSASMAQISKAARMSVGHIYHYFENKEAIIAAIVERQTQVIMSMLGTFDEADDIVETMIEHTDRRFELNEEISAPLMLEVIAEAARNPKVAKILRDANAITHVKQIETLRKIDRLRGAKAASEDDLEGRAEIIVAMMQGLMIRGIANPDYDRQSVNRVLKRTMRSLLES